MQIEVYLQHLQLCGPIFKFFPSVIQFGLFFAFRCLGNWSKLKRVQCEKNHEKVRYRLLKKIVYFKSSCVLYLIKKNCKRRELHCPIARHALHNRISYILRVPGMETCRLTTQVDIFKHSLVHFLHHFRRAVKEKKFNNICLYIPYLGVK